jgi:hypothetical protein
MNYFFFLIDPKTLRKPEHEKLALRKLFHCVFYINLGDLGRTRGICIKAQLGEQV